ncbi:hypothetical protein L596_004669 [Steinernema carpocapsae]|uniref:Uncharacterized protein n=1 Tax=Steinernema carpocapsae TaxID=34508 RepID=A0A4U8UWN6_STECR|nr:hypothetical protein L596_004669 [Steinernema carpocapsae]
MGCSSEHSSANVPVYHVSTELFGLFAFRLTSVAFHVSYDSGVYSFSSKPDFRDVRDFTFISILLSLKF